MDRTKFRREESKQGLRTQLALFPTNFLNTLNPLRILSKAAMPVIIIIIIFFLGGGGGLFLDYFCLFVRVFVLLLFIRPSCCCFLQDCLSQNSFERSGHSVCTTCSRRERERVGGRDIIFILLASALQCNVPDIKIRAYVDRKTGRLS